MPQRAMPQGVNSKGCEMENGGCCQSVQRSVGLAGSATPAVHMPPESDFELPQTDTSRSAIGCVVTKVLLHQSTAIEM